MKKHIGWLWRDGAYCGEKHGEYYLAADVDARIAELENALNLIRDGNADDECAAPLTKEDMQKIASHVLMDSVTK